MNFMSKNRIVLWDKNRANWNIFSLKEWYFYLQKKKNSVLIYIRISFLDTCVK